jgi:hypothetical protein
VFEAIDETGTVGLAYRDLVATATSAGRVNALCEAITAIEPAWAKPGTWLGDPSHRDGSTRNFLSTRGCPADAIEALAADPPLLLALLLEAAEECDGRHLGRLGSVLVGAPILRVLTADPLAPLPDSALTPAPDVRAIRTMPALIEFVHRQVRPDETVLAFL